MNKVAFTVIFWAAPSQPGLAPLTWPVNHDGPLESAILAGQATMKAGTYPKAQYFTIDDNMTGQEAYRSDA